MINKQKVFIATGGKAFDANKPALIMLHGAGMDHTVWSYAGSIFCPSWFLCSKP
jgi:pimeloyl-ACP methyl ester carboxylesterase